MSQHASTIVFDGDDTLWETELLYDRARSEAATLAATVGLSPDEFESLQKLIDISNAQTMGLSSARFPTSSIQAFEELARRKGVRT